MTDIIHVKYVDHFWRECDPRLPIVVEEPCIQEVFGEIIGEINLRGFEFIVVKSEGYSGLKGSSNEHRIHYIIKNTIIENHEFVKKE